MQFFLKSVFTSGAALPERYSGRGEGISPPLKWNDPPAGTKSFALIVDDPDAPAGDWVHWVVFNIPATLRELPEGVDVRKIQGARQGITDYGNMGYGPPYPPPGLAHRYVYKLYALNTALNLPEGATKAQLSKAMVGHILAEAQLVGLFKR